MKIFVQIASYRDPELIHTIKSCLENTKNPNNLVFGICRQFNPDDKFDDLSEYEKDKRFKILNIPHQDSLGVCWARNQVQQLYNEEEYTLQIDSHMRFEKNWDETLIGMIKQLQDLGIPKPLLTGYVPSYDPNNDPEGRVRVPWRMVFDKFTSDGIVTFLPETLPEWENIHIPIPTRFYSAGFCFTLGDFVKEIQHNPKLYFYGEEITIAVRAFTYGYDLFHPHRVVLWHEYIRKNKKKHWDDDKKWSEKNKISIFLVKRLLGIDGEPRDEIGSKYGLGNVRTLRDYEKYAGLLFSKRAVQKYTLEKNYPPNPNYSTETEFFASFIEFFDYEIKLDKTNLTEPDYNFWAVIFHDENGDEIFRKDIDKLEIQSLLSKDKIIIKKSFHTYQTPKTWTVWPYTESKTWVEKITGDI